MRTACSEYQRKTPQHRRSQPLSRRSACHLKGHQEGKFVDSLCDRLKGPAQDLPTLARRVLSPIHLSFAGRFKRRNGIVGLRVGYLTEALGGRGILHGERFALGGVAPFAADEQLLLTPLTTALSEVVVLMWRQSPFLVPRRLRHPWNSQSARRSTRAHLGLALARVAWGSPLPTRSARPACRRPRRA